MALTLKQEMFVREYLVDLNATQAAARAGYKGKNLDNIGSELLGKTCVKEAIIEATKTRAEKIELDATWVLTRLKLISDRCVQGEPVVDKEGNETGEWRFDAAGANRATELVGKHLGMFSDKLELTGKGGGPIQYEDVGKLTDEELKREIEKLSK